MSKKSKTAKIVDFIKIAAVKEHNPSSIDFIPEYGILIEKLRSKIPVIAPLM
ncbi:MAG: hypothetical protein HWQ41_03305 [Nostoc sp. NOS(2021)]|uniref:hypothetical protein n=1 Tax=Nostoc sp. NOS(2021) TaxID=2815407 RepID=UPI0025D2E407|nr:hypothetical protein [Nostoc sp. NOS(2021)]MBN3894321.1 hypothetical protein [Nostoc sp. NOS(2021)]